MALIAMSDKMFESSDYEGLVGVLREEARRQPDSVDILWRLARGLKKLSDPLPKAQQEPLVREALALADRALQADSSCGPAHKWCAVEPHRQSRHTCTLGPSEAAPRASCAQVCDLAVPGWGVRVD